MVATFQTGLETQSGLLQQVGDHVSTRKFTRLIEPDTDEFTKSGRVVIPYSLGIAPSLEYGIGLNNLVFQSNFPFFLLALAPILAK